MSELFVQELGNNLLNIYTLYHSSFDDDIRTPWTKIQEKVNFGLTRGLIFRENSVEISGFVMWTPSVDRKTVFIDYFCVNKSLQGCGLGRKYFSFVISELENFFENIILDCKGNLVDFYTKYNFQTVDDVFWYGVPLKLMIYTKKAYLPVDILNIYQQFQ